MSEILGDGTFGVVYKAHNIEKNEIVAIKKLKSKIYSWQECIDLKEIKSLSKLKNHNNIIKLKEVIREPNSEIFFVFEFADQNLFQIMEKYRKCNQEFTEQKIKEIIYQIALGLNYMHSNGYFHRDLKPENVLMTDNVVKIADFGSSKELVGNLSPLTDYICTRWYRSPECILKSTNYNAAMDIWALGTIMAELYTLKPLFPGTSEFDQLYQVINIFGTPKMSDWSEGYKLIQKLGMKFPNSKGVPLENIVKLASSGGINMLYEMLCLDPSRRITAAQLVNHSFFQDIKIYQNGHSTLSKISTTGLNNYNISPKTRRVNNNLTGIYNNNPNTISSNIMGQNINNNIISRAIGDTKVYLKDFNVYKSMNSYLPTIAYNSNNIANSDNNQNNQKSSNINSNNGSRFSYLAQNELNMNNKLTNLRNSNVYRNNKSCDINEMHKENKTIEEQSRRFNVYNAPEYGERMNKNIVQGNRNDYNTYFKF